MFSVREGWSDPGTFSEGWLLYSNSFRSSCGGAAETNPTRNHRVAGSIPRLNQWVKDPALLWLWCRLAAVAPIRPLAWEPPHAASATLKTNKQKRSFKSYAFMRLSIKNQKERGTRFNKGKAHGLSNWSKRHCEELPLWHSGLRIWCCHCSTSGGCCGSGSVPGPGTSTSYSPGQRRKQKA